MEEMRITEKIFKVAWDGKHATIGEEVADGRLVRYTAGIGCFRFSQDGRTISRFSGGGRRAWSYTFQAPGEYMVGPRYAHRVVNPADEVDPLKRVLRERGIGLSQVKWMEQGETLEVSEFSCDIQRSYSAGTSTRRWKTDGKVEVAGENVKFSPQTNQYCGPEAHSSIRIIGGSWAVASGQYVQVNGLITSRIWEVAIWPGCDPAKLAEALSLS